MVTEQDRILEWLNRSANQIKELRKKPRLAREKHLAMIRENYQIINVLTMVTKGEAYMIGIAPPPDN